MFTLSGRVRSGDFVLAVIPSSTQDSDHLLFHNPGRKSWQDPDKILAGSYHRIL